MNKVRNFILGFFTVVFVVGAMVGTLYLVQQRSENTAKQSEDENIEATKSPSTEIAIATNMPTVKPDKTKKPGKISKAQSIEDEAGNFNPLKDYLGYIESTKTTWNQEKPEVPVYLEEELFDPWHGIKFNQDAGGVPEDCMASRGDWTDIIFRYLPTTAIREGKDKSYIYAMYDSETGIRLYLFFSKSKHSYKFLDGFPVKMSKKRPYSDFASLQPGDLYEEVVALEPSIDSQFREKWDNFSDSPLEKVIEDGDGPATIHILTDGAIKIDYIRNSNKQYVISNIIYAKDFVLEGLDGKTCYEIHPDDYVEE